MTVASTCSTCCVVYAKCVIVGLLAVIGVCIFGAIKGPAAVNDIIDKEVSAAIDQMFVLAPSNEVYETWENPPIPIYQKFYLFDVQNADDVMNGAKPRLVEIGPYTYRMNVSRYNISFVDNDTLSFQQMSWLSFVPELSSGHENDTFTTLNIPLAASASAVKHRSWFERLTISAIAGIHEHHYHGMFITLTVGELLWGYEDPFMKQMQDLAGEENIPTAKIGILPNMNGSVTSAVINTGASNITLLNKLIEWEGKTKLEWWGSEEANTLKGSDGSLLHPGMTAEETIYVYDQVHFRSLPYIYSGDRTLHDIPMMRFHIPWYAYANASRYPPNAGFCLQDTCPDGILNVTQCTKAPFGISLPHFLYASPDIIESFDGLEPNETDHQSYIVIEPITGVSYKQRRRLQMNLYMESVDGISQTEGIRSMYYPLTWLETSVDVPESMATLHKDRMSVTEGIDDIVFYAFIATAAFCLVVIILISCCLILRCCRNKKRIQISASKSAAYESVKVEASVPTKPYSNGVPNNIYSKLPNEDNDNNDTLDKNGVPAVSTVLSEYDDEYVHLRRGVHDNGYHQVDEDGRVDGTANEDVLHRKNGHVIILDKESVV